MKKHGIMVLALVVAVSFMFTSCDAAQAFIDALYSVSGKVVNIKASASTAYYKSSKSTATLVGATVTYTLTSDANKKYTGTVNSEGKYTISSVPNGKYTITGSQSGWTFIPQTFVVSSTTYTKAPDLLAFATAEAGTLTVVMTWENTGTDMDLHMTWGTLASAGSSSANHLQSTEISSGADSKTGTGWSAKLDRDVYGSLLTSSPLVETITLTATGGAISPNDGSYNSADNVNINNTFRFYIDAFNKASGTTGYTDSPAVAPAGATLHFFQGSTHYGSYYAPYNTAERTLRIAKVAFDGTTSNNFTLFTDIESVTAGTYRDLGIQTIGKPVNAIE